MHGCLFVFIVCTIHGAIKSSLAHTTNCVVLAIRQTAHLSSSQHSFDVWHLAFRGDHARFVQGIINRSGAEEVDIEILADSVQDMGIGEDEESISATATPDPASSAPVSQPHSPPRKLKGKKAKEVWGMSSTYRGRRRQAHNSLSTA